MERWNYATNFLLNTNIALFSLGALSELGRRTRKHSPAKIKKLAQSIAKSGYLNPLLLDEKYAFIAGHARLEAARRLGMDKVPVILLPGLSEAQKVALRIADNKLAEDAKWNVDNLALELSELIAPGFDIELAGFDPIELDRLLTPPALDIDDLDIPEPPPDPISRSGDIWHCGDHFVVCGDCLDPAVSASVLQGRQADIVITDVPYNLETSSFRGAWKGSARRFQDGSRGDDGR